MLGMKASLSHLDDILVALLGFQIDGLPNANSSTAPWGQKWPMRNLIENSPRKINTIGGLIGAILTYFSQKNQISRDLLGDRPLGKV